MAKFVGDAFAAGKRKSTTADGPVDKKKNHKGQSFKTVFPGSNDADDTGDAGTHKVTRRMTKGMRPGVGARKSTKSEPAPYAERNHRGTSYKHVPPRDRERESGSDDYYSRIHKWVNGK